MPPLPPLETGDGFVVVTCEREMTERIYREAVSLGQLSIKKGAVRDVHHEMYQFLLRMMAGWPTLRLVVGDATTNVAAPSFAVFEGWEARTINLTDDGP
jgi:hypothetical protein